MNWLYGKSFKKILLLLLAIVSSVIFGYFPASFIVITASFAEVTPKNWLYYLCLAAMIIPVLSIILTLTCIIKDKLRLALITASFPGLLSLLALIILQIKL